MDAELVLRILDELYGIHDITITGGEPLLHPDFPKILSHASRCASIVYVMTNGIFLVGLELLKKLANNNKNLHSLKHTLKNAMDEFPENVHLFFPLDTFHLKAFRPYKFLLKGLSQVAREWNLMENKPFIGFLSNDISPEVSKRLCDEFNVGSCCHVGTAIFSPWRKVSGIYSWYRAHPLNQTPFPGGIYINYKGVYLNEGSLLLDLREGIETPLKIGMLDKNKQDKRQLYNLYLTAFQR